jgi:hypothetical protein
VGQGGRGAHLRLAEALRIARDVGLPGNIAYALVLSAVVAHDEGNRERARHSVTEALSIFRDFEAPSDLCLALEAFAAIAHTLHGGLVAARVWGCAERARETLGSSSLPSFHPWQAREVMAARAAVNDETAFGRAWQDGRIRWGYRASIAVSLHHLIDTRSFIPIWERIIRTTWRVQDA